MPRPNLSKLPKEKLNIPKEVKLYIDPNVRLTIFKNILDNYKAFLPGLHRIYAYLNYNKDIPIDYLIINEAIDETGRKAIMWDMPILYSNRTTPAFKYVIKNNLYKDFFDDVVTQSCKMDPGKFNEFIVHYCKLSLDKNDPLYWKNQANSNKFIKELFSISLLFGAV